MPEKNRYPDPADIQLLDEREGLQRILGYPPGWALRWGITAVFVATLAFLALAWLVKYPDVISGQVVILAENPPIRIVARNSGKMEQLLVKDKQPVVAGQLVAILENPALPEDAFLLEALLARLEGSTEPEQLLGLELPNGLQLGELQRSYANFQQAVRDFQFFEQQQGTFARIASLEQQISYLESLNAALRQQEQTLEMEVALARKDYERNRQLGSSGTISEVDLETSQTNYLRYRRQLENLQAELLENHLQAEQFRSQIIQLRQGHARDGMEKGLAALALLGQLQAEWGNWQTAYLLRSPIDGQLSLSHIWKPQQFVTAGEAIATVVPNAGAGDMTGRALVPAFNSGKVKIGMRADIRLDAFPHQEFGLLRGTVGSIALVPEQKNYLVEIHLPDSLLTTYQRAIPPSQELSGTVRIITQDRSILSRIFGQLLSLIKNY